MRFTFFEKFLTPFTILVFAATLVASLAPYISPQRWWMMAFFGLGFPYIYLLNFVFLVFWVIKKRKIALLLLVSFLAGFNTVTGFIQFRLHAKQPLETRSSDLKIMSFNVRSFDLYNWLPNWLGTAKARENIFRMIERESPAIICFQEFYHCDTGRFATIDTMIEKLNYRYSHIVLPVKIHGVDHWGMAIFSKYPIISKGEIKRQRKGANLFLFANVKINSDTVRIYNCHLQSIRFRQEDYKFVNELGYNLEEEKLSGVKKIAHRLKTAFARRASQAEVIAAHVRTSQYPVILCGDFNDTPSSYTYHQLAGTLCDAFKQSGSGIGTTYSGPFPAFRIDFIFHSPQFSSYRYKTIREKLSDHYSLTAVIRIP